MPKADLTSNDSVVLGTLEKAGKPLSAYDILDSAPSGTLKAPVQVYRALQKLEDRGLVHRIEALNAFVACSDAGHPRHEPAFVICRKCGEVREFEDDRLIEVARKAAGPGFAMDTVSVEVFGLCARCGEAGDLTQD